MKIDLTKKTVTKIDKHTFDKVIYNLKDKEDIDYTPGFMTLGYLISYKNVTIGEVWDGEEYPEYDYYINYEFSFEEQDTDKIPDNYLDEYINKRMKKDIEDYKKRYANG